MLVNFMPIQKILINNVITKTSVTLLCVCLSAFIIPSTGMSACTDDQSKTDQSLVIAVDISQSVNDEEMYLQMQGYSTALLATEATGSFLNCGCSEITVLFWGQNPQVAIPTTKIKSISDLETISAFFASTSTVPAEDLQKQYGTGYTTMVDRALIESLNILKDPQNTSVRRTLLISGDGPQNEYSEEQFENIKQSFLYEGISIYATPISVYEDTREGRAMSYIEEANDSDFRSPYTEEEVQSDLNITPDFYRKNVITHPAYLHRSSSFADLQRALIETLTNFQCLLM